MSASRCTRARLATSCRVTGGSVFAPARQRSAPSLLVDPGLEHAASRDLRQQLVGVALLVESLVEQVLRIAEIELVGERTRRAVGGDLVMLDALRRRDQRRVFDDGITDRGDDLL